MENQNIKLDALILQERLLGTTHDLINQGTFPGHYSANIVEVLSYLKAIHGQVKLAKEQLQASLEGTQVHPESIITPDAISEVKSID